MDKQWIYYNHALIPNVEPHKPCVIPQNKNLLWKSGGRKALLARYITDFDCGYKTDWWYVIKDTPFDINELKSKRRYEIRKGEKNFTVKRINPIDYCESLYNVTIAAYTSWPKKYRPIVNKDVFYSDIKKWNNAIVYGGFDNETNELCAYTFLIEYQEHLEFNVLRVNPKFEKKGINAAMVLAILKDYNNKLGRKFYINDGSRCISHETAFQDYLEKYFNFRKAYCKLHMIYRFPLDIFIKLLFPFRKHLNKDSKYGKLLYSIMLMEEITRHDKGLI